MFRYARLLKNRDLVFVCWVCTSRGYCPLPSSTSCLGWLAPYYFITAATPPAVHSPGLHLLLIAWLDNHGCMHRCPCLCVVSSCILPLSSWEYATPPAVFLVDSGIDFVLPHTLISAGSVTNLPLGYALSATSQSIWPRYIYLSCVVPSYVFVLLGSESLPLLEGMWFVAGLWVG